MLLNVSGLPEEVSDPFPNLSASFLPAFPGVFPVPLAEVSVPPSLSGVR